RGAHLHHWRLLHARRLSGGNELAEFEACRFASRRVGMVHVGDDQWDYYYHPCAETCHLRRHAHHCANLGRSRHINYTCLNGSDTKPFLTKSEAQIIGAAVGFFLCPIRGRATRYDDVPHVERLNPTSGRRIRERRENALRCMWSALVV